VGPETGTNTNKEVTMKKGNKVLVPRTGGGTSEGEVIEIYRKHARVKFLVGDMFRGKSAPPEVRSAYGYKTIRQDALRVIKEG
jgi:hypothetical protein